MHSTEQLVAPTHQLGATRPLQKMRAERDVVNIREHKRYIALFYLFITALNVL